MSDHEFEAGDGISQIQSGPETPADEHADTERAVNPRDAMLLRIAARVEAAREVEIAEGEEMQEEARSLGLTLDSAEQGEELQPRHSRHQAPQRQTQQPAQQQQPADDLVWADLGNGPVQLTRAQDAHLRQVGMIAAQSMADYQRQQAAVPQPMADRGLIRQTVRELQYGSEDSAEEALLGLVQHVAAKQPNAELVVQRHMQEAAARERLQQHTEIIRREYPDLMNDNVRAGVAALEVQKIKNWAANTGQTFDELSILREAGNRTRAAFQSAPAGRQSQNQYRDGGNIVIRRSVDEIEGRKRAAPRAVAQVIDRRSSGPQQEKRPTTGQIIDQMRKSRGQAPLG